MYGNVHRKIITNSPEAWSLTGVAKRLSFAIDNMNLPIANLVVDTPGGGNVNVFRHGNMEIWNLKSGGDQLVAIYKIGKEVWIYNIDGPKGILIKKFDTGIYGGLAGADEQNIHVWSPDDRAYKVFSYSGGLIRSVVLGVEEVIETEWPELPNSIHTVELSANKDYYFTSVVSIVQSYDYDLFKPQWHKTTTTTNTLYKLKTDGQTYSVVNADVHVVIKPLIVYPPGDVGLPVYGPEYELNLFNPSCITDKGIYITRVKKTVRESHLFWGNSWYAPEAAVLPDEYWMEWYDLNFTLQGSSEHFSQHELISSFSYNRSRPRGNKNYVAYNKTDTQETCTFKYDLSLPALFDRGGEDYFSGDRCLGIIGRNLYIFHKTSNWAELNIYVYGIESDTPEKVKRTITMPDVLSSYSPELVARISK